MQSLKSIIRKEANKIIFLAFALSLSSCGNFDRGTYQIGNSKVNYQISKWSGSPYVTEIQNDGDTLKYEGFESNTQYRLEEFELNGKKYTKENNDCYPEIWNAAEERLNYLVPKLDSLYKEKLFQETQKVISAIKSE